MDVFVGLMVCWSGADHNCVDPTMRASSANNRKKKRSADRFNETAWVVHFIRIVQASRPCRMSSVIQAGSGPAKSAPSGTS